MWSNKKEFSISYPMRSSRLLLVFCVFLCGVGAGFAVNPASSAPVTPILPQQFGGWQMQGAAQTSSDPGAADPTNAAVLKEYGFTDFASSTYTREDGRTVKIRAARFADASGGFGAYTFYLQPDMTREQIGDQGASLGQRVLLYRGHIVIDALFSKESPMSGAVPEETRGTCLPSSDSCRCAATLQTPRSMRWELLRSRRWRRRFRRIWLISA